MSPALPSEHYMIAKFPTEVSIFASVTDPFGYIVMYHYMVVYLRIGNGIWYSPCISSVFRYFKIQNAPLYNRPT